MSDVAQRHLPSLALGIATNNNTSLSPPNHHPLPWQHCHRRLTPRRSKRRLFIASFFLVLFVILITNPLGRHADLHRIDIVDVALFANKRRSQSSVVTMTDVGHPDHNLSLTSSSEAAAANFFNCQRPNSKCHYFNPSTFLHTYYASLSNNNNDSDFNIQQWRRQIGFDNYNLPALDVLSWWWSITPTTPNNDDSYNASYSNSNNNDNESILMLQQQYNITYIHIHKCGGTSIQGALYSRARAIRQQQYHQQQGVMKNDISGSTTRTAKVHTYKYSFGGGSRSKKESRDKARLEYIRSIATTQQQYQHQQQQRMKLNSSSSSSSLLFGHSTNPMIFTIVRDPIERVLSGIQQIMHYNIELRSKCLFEKTTTVVVDNEDEERILRQRTIGCAITDIETTNYRNDVHLQPMMAHFRILDGEGGGLVPPNPRQQQQQQQQQHDDEGETSSGVTVSVFAMEDINFVLSHLLGQEQQLQHNHNSTIVRRPNNDDTSSSSSSTKKIIHARDRSDATYATSTILASLSVADCTDDMIQRLCTLYQVDVEMMRYIGFGGFAVDICP